MNMIIDCHYLCWGASFALPDMSAEDQEVGVIYGFLRQILSLSKKFKTKDFYFCWDSKKSHRKLIFPDYKKKRAAKKKEMKPEDLSRILATHEQIGKLRNEILPTMGFNNSFFRNGYEADDLICHLVRKLKGPNTIISSDEDLYQLLDHADMYSTQKGKVFKVKDLAKKYNGCTPKEWVDVKALGGCGSDEVPGIKGVGAIKAVKYLHGEMKPGVIKERIESEEGRSIYKRNLELVKLPLHEGVFDVADNIQEDTITSHAMLTLFEKYRFASFLRGDAFSSWVTNFTD